MKRSLRTLLDGVFDYAGLFPPAQLDMPRACEEFARQRMGEHAWISTRIVCPSSRLEELSAHAALMPGTHATSGYREMADTIEPWRISALLPSDAAGLERGLDDIDAFNERHADEGGGLAFVDQVELKLTDPGFFDDAMEAIPEDLLPCFEIPVIDADCRGLVAALSGDSAAAKIRCGGVTESLIPSPSEVAGFIHACRHAAVPFKATAGLHHPVRAEQALTYEPDAPRAVMHGFLNLFMAAALVAHAKLSETDTIRVLEETDPHAFSFTETHASWRDHSIGLVEIAKARESVALGIGSCSVQEPLQDLRSLGLL